MGAPGRYINPAIAPDASRIAVTRLSPSLTESDLWLFEPRGERPLTAPQHHGADAGVTGQGERRPAPMPAAALGRGAAEARANPGRPLAISAASEVIAIIEAAGGTALLARLFGVRVDLRADAAAARSRFDIHSG